MSLASSSLKNIYIKYKEQILYLLFGIATTLVNWLVYVLLLNVFVLEISNAIAWLVAITFAFHVNKIYVFKRPYSSLKKTLRELFLFLGARVLSGFVDIFGLPLLVYIGIDQTVFGIEGAVAKLIVSVVGIVLNYIFSKFVIFGRK